MANIALSTIGVKISYCIETTSGTRPTSGYTHITGIKSTPELNVAPSTADATTFDNEAYTTKIDLLKEIPDSLEFNAIFGQELYNTWSALVQSAKTALASNKETWFCIQIPNFDKAIFFKGKPSAMGIPSMEANSAIETTLYVIPTGEPIFDTAPTN